MVNLVPDLALHAIAYSVLAGAYLYGLTEGGRSGAREGWRLTAAVLLALAFGATDEWHQSFVAGRDASAVDWLADAAGAIAMTVVVRLWWSARGRGTGGP